MVSIIRSHEVQPVHDVKFVDTNIPGTPFSFFHFIFWNREIDLRSETGQQIFKHELVHVREKHSIDKLVVQLVLVFFWCNPFFWLIRRELRHVHEFIADQKSVGEHGSAAFAAMVLHSAYPGRFNAVGNPFFQTTIKRRLAMLGKTSNPRINYFSRIFALLLITATFFAFTVRTQQIKTPVAMERTIKVVIDAGHGKQDGKYNGARREDLYEDDITLSIARKVAQLNKNSNIQIIMTRTGDDYVGLKERVAIAKQHGADLFISIHTNAQVHPKADSSGIELYISRRNSAYEKRSAQLGTVLQQELQSVYTVKPYIKQHQAGVWVLDQNDCPAVLVECGYITNAADRAFITDEKNQNAVALAMLSAIERFATQPEINIQPTDTLPEKLSMQSPVKSGDMTYTKVDKEAAIDKETWRTFLSSKLTTLIEEAASKGAPPGQYTVQVRFIVEKDGNISDIKLVKDPGHGLGGKVLELMKDSPKWEPAVHKKKKVRSYYTQPITFVIAEE